MYWPFSVPESGEDGHRAELGLDFVSSVFLERKSPGLAIEPGYLFHPRGNIIGVRLSQLARLGWVIFERVVQGRASSECKLYDTVQEGVQP